MLALKQALSLVSTPILGSEWSPDDEASIMAWYQNKVGVILNASDVSNWLDSAGAIHMSQTSSGKQPAYNASTGALTFISADRDFLSSTAQIELPGAFTIGIRWNPDLTGTGTFLGDNTNTGHRYKINSSSQIIIAIGGVSKSFNLDSGTFGDNYIVITRDGSDEISLWNNGVLQFDKETLGGTSEIDAISVRYSNIDNFDGTISEIQIYSSTSADLTANVNDRLSTL